MEKTNFILLKNIINGWANNIKNELGTLDSNIKERGEKILLICDSCDLRVGNKCSTLKKGKAVQDFFYKVENQQRKKEELYKGCGCNLSAKVLCDECQCPLGKWDNNKI